MAERGDLTVDLITPSQQTLMVRLNATQQIGGIGERHIADS